MNTNPLLAEKPQENGAKNSAENVHLRESRPENDIKSAQIVEVSFNTPNTRLRESSKSMPRKPRNLEVRSREYLTPAEVEKLLKAAETLGRHGHRDATLVLVAYRHGLRVSELIALRWDQLDLSTGLMHVNRLKNGTPSTHPIRGPELRALRRLAVMSSI